MRLFVIHRSNDRKKAKKVLKCISKSIEAKFLPIFIANSRHESWKIEAEKAMEKSEVVIVFNKNSCEKSQNTKWEIDKAISKNKNIICLNEGNNESSIKQLKSLYELEEEFEKCFPSSNENVLELYKLMIESSESLIQRRQKTNAFFITAIGSLLATAGLLVKVGLINNDSFWMLYGFLVVGLLLCNSWRNLVDNYGKLNKAKFDVILRLEQNLGAQIYFAEWVSLGKGLRSKKYRSFTSTEKNVPLFFGILIIVFIGVAVVWHTYAWFTLN